MTLSGQGENESLYMRCGGERGACTKRTTDQLTVPTSHLQRRLRVRVRGWQRGLQLGQHASQ
jgi:hypothetical protein